MAVNDSNLAGVERRLDAIIRLLAAPMLQGRSQAGSVHVLAGMGLDGAAIAEITGIAPNIVRARLCELRRRGGERPKRRKREVDADE